MSAFENGRISNFEGLVTLTLTLDRVMLHTVVHHSSTSTHMPNYIKIEETSWTDGRTHVCTDVRTDILRPALLGRLCRRVDLKRSLMRVNITENDCQVLTQRRQQNTIIEAGVRDDKQQDQRENELTEFVTSIGTIPIGKTQLVIDRQGRVVKKSVWHRKQLPLDQTIVSFCVVYCPISAKF